MAPIVLVVVLLFNLVSPSALAQHAQGETGVGLETKKKYSTELEGYGLDAKQFEPLGNMPPPVQEVARNSLRKLCACAVFLDSCITTFAYGPGFLLNEHALQALESMVSGAIKEGKNCPDKFLVVEPDGKATPVQLSIQKRGVYSPSPGDRGSEKWKPEDHYKKRLEDVSDHRQDLALIGLKGLRMPAVPIQPGDGNFSVNRQVYHLGFSAGPALDLKQREEAWKSALPQASSGQVRAIKHKNIEANFLGINGTSGGPVLSDDGKLLGVFWGKEQTFRESFTTLRLRAFYEKNGYPHERSYLLPLEAVKSFIP